jgi:hypothetical protein
MAGFALTTAVLCRSLRDLVPVFGRFPVNKLANSVLLLNEYGKSFAFVSKKKIDLISFVYQVFVTDHE